MTGRDGRPTLSGTSNRLLRFGFQAPEKSTEATHDVRRQPGQVRMKIAYENNEALATRRLTVHVRELYSRGTILDARYSTYKPLPRGKLHPTRQGAQPSAP